MSAAAVNMLGQLCLRVGLLPGDEPKADDAEEVHDCAEHAEFEEYVLTRF